MKEILFTPEEAKLLAQALDLCVQRDDVSDAFTAKEQRILCTLANEFMAMSSKYYGADGTPR